MTKVDKIEAKRTKPGTGMKRVQEIEAEGEFILNLISLILYRKLNPKVITPLLLNPYTVNPYKIAPPKVVRQLEMMNKNFSEMMRQFQTIKAVDTKCETCGGPHSFTECPAVDGYTQKTAYATTGRGNNFNQVPTNQAPTHQPQVVPQVSDFQAYMKANDAARVRFQAWEDLKAITTHSSVTLTGSSVSPPPLSKEVDREPETITDQVLTGSTNNVPPLVVQPSPTSTSFTTISSSKMLEVTKDTLADRSTTRPAGIAEEVFVKVGKFHFPTDFIVVDYVMDPLVPLILGRPFLRTGRALIDVYGEELTIRVDDEAITFKVGQTSKYSYNDAESINRVDVINIACEEYVQEVLGFFDNSKSGNPTPIFDPIIALSSPSLTPFEGDDFILEEIEACLTSESIPPGIDDTDLDLVGDIRLLEKLLNNDPSLCPLPLKELNVKEIKTVKSSIDEPLKLELKDLPSHLEYAYLEGTDKLPVIIAKGLKDDEKEAILKVLKSHKRAIAWKICDIKGIDPYFCTQKILMEDDFKPTVQSQRRVNPKIHEVIKKEVIKLLDAEMIYPISDSPWVIPVYCVPKKGGITVFENEVSELIPTRLVIRWRVCIDYQKLNDATRKDHFPLPFMDQMLERLAGNEFYCFLDGFSGYFQIPIDPQDQENTTFTCPYGTFAYRRIPFWPLQCSWDIPKVYDGNFP
uniref:DNA-directed DNA polymerase n=1 Tax=Tanacetum cinerariifolium TaxID=118510 RepID=A0A6L2MCJ5_TANCI|nr:DNA-directed DNA polymerase [Tanacetum cinerariifolium]